MKQYKINTFGIKLGKVSTDNIFNLSTQNLICDFKIPRFTINKNPVIIQADPFVFLYNDTLFLFYEEQQLGKCGIIKMIQSKDLQHWSKPVIVLKEPFHLSFPFVFSLNNEVYMLPESGADDSIRLYKSLTSDLTKWTFVRTLICSERKNDVIYNYADSSIISKDGWYYLFTSVFRNNIYYQELYYSDSIDGEWRKHPCSPIHVGNKYGRNAGCVFTNEGEFFRPTQDCRNSYGENVSILRIKNLTPISYSEEVYKENILPLNKYKNGGHQYNHIKMNNFYIVATDYRGKTINLLHTVKIFIKELLRIILSK